MLTVVGGASGVKDLAGNALAANAFSSFTTTRPRSSRQSLWSTSAMPAMVDGDDAQSIELGVKFTANTNGYITGVEFYKAAANTGVAYRQPVVGDRTIAGHRHLHERDRQRLADAGVLDARGRDSRHDLCGQLSHERRPLLG